MILKPLPELLTSRLILRKLTESDVNDLFEMRNNSLMHVYTDTVPDNSTDDTKKYLNIMMKGLEEKQWLIWGIELLEEQKLIGSISLWNFNEDMNNAEFGFGLNPHYHGKGYMQEALAEVAKYAFQLLEFNHLLAYTEEENHPSIKLLTKSGFELIDKIKEEGYYKKQTFTMLIFKLANPNPLG